MEILDIVYLADRDHKAFPNREFNLGHDVFAYFPTEAGDYAGNRTCFVHIGQHGACSPVVAAEADLASPREYANLHEELTGRYCNGEDAVGLRVLNEVLDGQTLRAWLRDDEFTVDALASIGEPGDMEPAP